MRQGLQWRVCNGRSVAFWRDRWLERRPLCDAMVRPVCEEKLDNSVCHYWDSQTDWTWGRLEHNLPASILVKLASAGLDPDGADRDSFVWREGRQKFR